MSRRQVPIQFALVALTIVRLSCAISTGKHLRRSHRNVTKSVEQNITNVNGSTAVLASTASTKRPVRVFFLFMAVDKVSNLGVWTSFFAQAPPSQYRALVHCKMPACTASVAGTVLKTVPTVPSYYCTDLVSPMHQLLAYALQDEAGSVNPADKFAFVSDSTLPAKPFAYLYSSLAMRQGSDFCVFPSNEWADIQEPVGAKLEVAVKVHQWIVLVREHAQKATALWAQGNMHNFMWKFQMNSQSFSWYNNSFADHRNFGCLDEFWHMAALFGTIKDVQSSTPTVVGLSHFTNSPLRVSKKEGWQGSCDTFVMWAKYLNTEGDNPFKRLHAALDPVSVPHGGNAQRPGWWDTISANGISAIRNSEFLFVRKFIDNPRLAQGGDFAEVYSNMVFGR